MAGRDDEADALESAAVGETWLGAARITRAVSAPSYAAPNHTDVDAVRLQGREAGPTDAFWVGESTYRPGGIANRAPVRAESVYVVLSGELTLTVDDQLAKLGAGDSVHLPQGVEREVENRSSAPATMLVVMANPAATNQPGS
jgi:mannose-6-phosphate isomerase-like protein (cupin superfamily)